jgi:hypothetical protein
MRHLPGINEFNLVEQRNWLANPIKNAFPSLTKVSFFQTVDWNWSDEQKDWTPFIPVDERQYVAEKEDKGVDYKGYLERVVRHITVQGEKPPMVRVSVSFGRLNLTKQYRNRSRLGVGSTRSTSISVSYNKVSLDVGIRFIIHGFPDVDSPQSEHRYLSSSPLNLYKYNSDVHV